MSAPPSPPPSALEDHDVERYALGAAMLYPDALADLVAVAAPDDLTGTGHAELLRALVAVDAQPGGRVGDGSIASIDAAHLRAELTRRGVAHAVTVQYAVSCTDATRDGDPPTPLGARVAAARIADLAQRRRLAHAAREIAALALSEATAGDAVAAALVRLESVARTGDGSRAGRTYAAALTALLTRDRREAAGWALPWPSLSAALGGARRGRLIVVAARPAVGKSAWALNAALALAAPRAWDPRSVDAPVPVLFFALEMPDEELAGRGCAALARVNARDLELGEVQPDDEADVARAVDGTRKAPLVIDDRTTSVARMRTVAQAFFRRHGPGVVIVDYLQLCDARGLDLERDANRERRVAEMSRAFKLLAKELGVCVILLAQLNRTHSDTERPDLRALRESGAVEQDADAVVFLYGPKPKPGELTRDVKAYVAKCRGGAGDVEIPLRYVRAHTRFDEAEGAYDALPLDDAPEPYSVGGYEMGAPRG